MVDPYGVKITEGCRVAYNFQGEVRTGVVVGFQPTKVYWMQNPYILVAETATQKVSKVSRPTNLVVLSAIVTGD